VDELINKKITICYGPLSWFSELVEKEKKKEAYSGVFK